ncbi:MAG: hypothetical protein ABW223_10970, partial [Rariglobus sp.]
PVAPSAATPLTPPSYAPVPGKTPLKLSTPPPAGLRPAGAPAPVTASGSPIINKLPESPKFVSPMPAIEEADDSVPVALPIVAGFAAVAAIVVAVLLFLKQ